MIPDALVAQLSEPLLQLISHGTTLHVAVVDRAGQTIFANAAFAKTWGGNPVGRAWPSLVTGASQLALLDHIAAGANTDILIQLVTSDGERSSLRVFPSALASGFAIVGEPPWDEHRALETQLLSLNAQLAVLVRENQRQTRLAEEAQRELHASHWHLKKVSDVLPVCVSCRSVKTGEQTWEAVSDFLARTADFLSHGYCARCAALLEAGLEEEP